MSWSILRWRIGSVIDTMTPDKSPESEPDEPALRGASYRRVRSRSKTKNLKELRKKMRRVERTPEYMVFGAFIFLAALVGVMMIMFFGHEIGLGRLPSKH